MQNSDLCIERYRDLKNVKLVGEELGIPWQTVYWRLKRAGEPVTGDKSRYGSETDRRAARGEAWFQRVVPEAVDQNALAYQPKVDFLVHGYGVDVKTASPRRTTRGVIQWCWSIKKQEAVADFFVCIALTSRDPDVAVHKALLIPGEMARKYQTIRASHANGAMSGKWAHHAMSSAELRDFFKEIAP
jgi:hypothetical protein